MGREGAGAPGRARMLCRGVTNVYQWTEGSGSTTLLLYFAFALVHDSRGIEMVNFTMAAALSAGMLMASAGTPYRLVPAHFYP